jgi:hypothetical protein
MIMKGMISGFPFVSKFGSALIKYDMRLPINNHRTATNNTLLRREIAEAFGVPLTGLIKNATPKNHGSIRTGRNLRIG